MGTRAAAFSAKIKSLRESQQKVSLGVVPTPTGSDLSTSYRWFSSTLLNILRDVPGLPYHMFLGEGYTISPTHHLIHPQPPSSLNSCTSSTSSPHPAHLARRPSTSGSSLSVASTLLAPHLAAMMEVRPVPAPTSTTARPATCQDRQRRWRDFCS